MSGVDWDIWDFCPKINALTFLPLSNDSKMRHLPINMLRELADKCNHHKKNTHYITIDTSSDYIETAYKFILWLYQK